MRDYRLLLLQIVLMPILYVVQELTVRLGIFTGKGHGELIRTVFGKGWAWLSVTGLGVATVGLPERPVDTGLGAVATQLVMAAVLVATAATIGKTGGASVQRLDSVGQLANALTPFLGAALGRLIFGLGVIGAAMVAAIVVSLACAWGGYRWIVIGVSSLSAALGIFGGISGLGN